MVILFLRKYSVFFFLQKLYDSHLNFHGKEHHLCTEQYVCPSQLKSSSSYFWEGGGPRVMEIQEIHGPESITTVKFYVALSAVPTISHLSLTTL